MKLPVVFGTTTFVTYIVKRSVGKYDFLSGLNDVDCSVRVTVTAYVCM